MGVSLESSRPIMAPSVSFLPLILCSALHTSVSTSQSPPHLNLHHLHEADHVFYSTACFQVCLHPFQHLQRCPFGRKYRPNHPLLRFRTTRNQRDRRWTRQIGEQEARCATLRPNPGENGTSEQVGIGSEAGKGSG